MSETKTYSIELNEELAAWVEAHAHPTPEAFIAELIKTDYEKVARLVEEGLTSGLSGKSHKQVIAEIRAKLSDAAA